MNIAVVADVHGRLLLCFKVVERYQRETGEKIDLILQCGDAGIYPDISRLDKATRRHAESDPTELGFAEHFMEPKDEVQAVLKRIDCSILCVRGNHEDHDYLDGLERASEGPTFTADCYRRIRVLKSGARFSFAPTSGEPALEIVGIGRVGPPFGADDQMHPKYVQPYEQDQILSLGSDRVDVLLTHDAARDAINVGFGMEEIRLVLDSLRPTYHFFGHTGAPFSSRLDANGSTIACKLADFEWDEKDRSRKLRPGCLGVLRWLGPDAHSFEVVEEPWMSEYSPGTWRHL